jgi:hypothetical protein
MMQQYNKTARPDVLRTHADPSVRLPAAKPRRAGLRRWHRITDRFGAAGSLVCALHCALVPVLIALAPGLGLGLLASAGFERAFLVFATVLALVSLIQGYRRHRAYRALMFLLPGLIAVWSTQWVSGMAHDGITHAVVMTLGGTLIGVAHVLNLRLSHAHVHDACCGH